MQKTLDTVKFLDSKKDKDEDLETRFELNDTLFATALIPPTEEVYLWLGANVMVAYPVDEAIELLTQKLELQGTNMKTCQEDLEFLREQITTMEVNIARTYNWDVKRRREAQPTTVEDASDEEDT
jgi:prefoldin subunit 5